MRIRRRRSDLADPHRAVLLPELHDAAVSDVDEDEPRAPGSAGTPTRCSSSASSTRRSTRAPRRRSPRSAGLVKITYLVLSAYAMGGTERSAITQANALAARGASTT